MDVKSPISQHGSRGASIAQSKIKIIHSCYKFAQSGLIFGSIVGVNFSGDFLGKCVYFITQGLDFGGIITYYTYSGYRV